MTPNTPPTPEEREQLLQTIEMFGVIVQASPNDAQSLEILKDAFVRLGQVSEAMVAARQLAEIFTQAEQYPQAVREYEYVLDHEPANVEVMAALGEVEEKMRAAKAAGRVPVEEELPGAIKNSQLMATGQTMKVSTKSAAAINAVTQALTDDGSDALVKFLLLHRIAPEDVVKQASDRISKKNKDLAPNTMAHSLLDEVVRRAGLDPETVLCAIVDRSKLAYIPLEYYEVDRQVVKMLPDTLTLGRLIVPFDVMSRTLMVAMANPFDAQGKEAVQKLLDFNIQWHIASPAAITKVLSEVYRVAPPGMIGATPETPGMKLAAAASA